MMPAPPGAVPPATMQTATIQTAALCRKCAGVGTHYLTCATLRLPAGYRVSGEYEPPLPPCLCGRPLGTCGVCA
jgi:hypothetical protein